MAGPGPSGARVQQLHLVGFTTDLEGLIFSARKGAKSGGYLVMLDDRLLATIEDALRLRNGEDDPGLDAGDGTSSRPRRPRPQSTLSPREIQARLRMGSSIAEVAEEAGVDEEWVGRFAAPILAEQAQVVTRARGLSFVKPRLGESALPLGDAVRWNLADREIRFLDDDFESAWSAYNLQGASWVVRIQYTSRGKRQTAEWEVDLREGELFARNRIASELAYLDATRRRRRPPVLEPSPRETPAAPAGRRDSSAGGAGASGAAAAAAAAAPASPAAAPAPRLPVQARPTRRGAEAGDEARPAAGGRATRGGTAKKATAKKTAAKKTAAKKGAGTRAATASSKKAVSKKAVSKKAVPTKKAAAKKAAAGPTGRAVAKAAARTGAARKPTSASRRAVRKAAAPKQATKATAAPRAATSGRGRTAKAAKKSAPTRRGDPAGAAHSDAVVDADLTARRSHLARPASPMKSANRAPAPGVIRPPVPSRSTSSTRLARPAAPVDEGFRVLEPTSDDGEVRLPRPRPPAAEPASRPAARAAAPEPAPRPEPPAPRAAEPDPRREPASFPQPQAQQAPRPQAQSPVRARDDADVPRRRAAAPEPPPPPPGTADQRLARRLATRGNGGDPRAAARSRATAAPAGGSEAEHVWHGPGSGEPAPPVRIRADMAAATVRPEADHGAPPAADAGDRPRRRRERPLRAR